MKKKCWGHAVWRFISFEHRSRTPPHSLINILILMWADFFHHHHHRMWCSSINHQRTSQCVDFPYAASQPLVSYRIECGMKIETGLRFLTSEREWARVSVHVVCGDNTFMNAQCCWLPMVSYARWSEVTQNWVRFLKISSSSGPTRHLCNFQCASYSRAAFCWLDFRDYLRQWISTQYKTKNEFLYSKLHSEKVGWETVAKRGKT